MSSIQVARCVPLSHILQTRSCAPSLDHPKTMLQCSTDFQNSLRPTSKLQSPNTLLNSLWPRMPLGRRLGGKPSSKMVPSRTLMLYKCPPAQTASKACTLQPSASEAEGSCTHARLLGALCSTEATAAVRMLPCAKALRVMIWARLAITSWQRACRCASCWCIWGSSMKSRPCLIRACTQPNNRVACFKCLPGLARAKYEPMEARGSCKCEGVQVEKL